MFDLNKFKNLSIDNNSPLRRLRNRNIYSNDIIASQAPSKFSQAPSENKKSCCSTNSISNESS